MNLALRGIEADFGPEHADTFRRDLHPDLRADYVLANPPFNDSDWFRKDDDVRWQFGVPPKGNANFAWVQHFIHHLAPAGPGTAGGMAGFVLANGSMSSNQSGEGDIRRALIDGDLVDCMVALPGQLFYSTQIPVCLWFLTKSKKADAKRGFRDRRKQTLFIDARKLGTLIDRVHRELLEADLQKITSTYHLWRSELPSTSGRRAGDEGNPGYVDVAGFCKSATTAEIAAHGHVLTPGRYVGAEEVEDDGDPFEEKMPRLSNKFTVTPNSVLLSKLNPHIPRIWLPDLHASRRSVCSTEFMVACSKPGVSREYLFSLFTSSAFASVYGTLVTGTTGSHQRIRPESVLDMNIIIPPPPLIKCFTAVTKPMFDSNNRNTDQSRTLATLRDTLRRSC